MDEQRRDDVWALDRTGVELRPRRFVDVTDDELTEDEVVRYAEGRTAAANRSRVAVLDDVDYLHLSVPVRNVGAGIGFVSEARRIPARDWIGSASVRAVPPGEASGLTFSVPSRASEYADARDAVIDAGEITVDVEYTDADALASYITRLVMVAMRTTSGAQAACYS